MSHEWRKNALIMNYKNKPDMKNYANYKRN